MKLIPTIKSSVYNPVFYSRIDTIPFGASIKYFLKLIAMLGIIVAILLTVRFSALLHPANFEPIINAFPKELEIQVKNGVVTTNVPEPYFVVAVGESAKENALVIDTKSEFTPSQFATYRTSVIVKKDFVAVQKNNTEITIVKLNNFGDITINQSLIRGMVGKALSYTNVFLPIAAFVIYIGVFIAGLMQLVFFLFIALLTWLITALLKRKMSYGKAYQTTLHASTLSILLFVLAFTATITLPQFSFAIILLLVVLLNTRSDSRAQTISQPIV